MANYTTEGDKTLTILVKKVSDTVVLCDLIAGKSSVEVMIKAADYDQLVKNGFFKQIGLSNGTSPTKYIQTSEVYSIPSVTTTED